MLQRVKYAVAVILFLFSGIIRPQANPLISSIINQVDPDRLMENLEYLTGVKEVTVPSGTFPILSRYAYEYTNLIAEEYLKQRLEAYGLETYQQNHDNGIGNIYAIQHGITYPEQQIIICAHFDSMPRSYIAPGADDNGSGTSAVLEAARILSKYPTDYTIIYALWDNEELGLQGSSYYAQQARLRNDKIIAVINMDMIGWDGNNDNIAEIHARDYSTSYLIAENMAKVNSDYSIGLVLQYINPGTSASDHASFWYNNYPAVLLIEDYYTTNGLRDFNPYYHSGEDRIKYINKTYFEKCSKVAIGTLALYAGVQNPTYVHSPLPSSYTLSQNYPNPFNSTTVINYSIDKEMPVKIVVHDLIGRELAVLVDEVKPPASYSVNFDASLVRGGLSSGLYFYSMYSGNYTISRKMLYLK